MCTLKKNVIYDLFYDKPNKPNYHKIWYVTIEAITTFIHPDIMLIYFPVSNRWYHVRCKIMCLDKPWVEVCTCFYRMKLDSYNYWQLATSVKKAPLNKESVTEV